MDEKTREWIIQADFDIETAEFMFQGSLITKEIVLNTKEVLAWIKQQL